MIGQETVLKKLLCYNFNTLPTNLLLIGPFGAGKHTIVTELQKQLNVNLINIDQKVVFEDLLDITYSTVDKLCLINLTDFSENQQNKLLKFIEEPHQHLKCILISETKLGILDTILNRCIIYYLEQYSIQQLQKVKVFKDDLIYRICKTPGQLLVLDDIAFEQAKQLSILFLNNVSRATFANTLSLITKFNFKEDYNKISLDLFFQLLLYFAYEDYKVNNNKVSLKIYFFTNNFIKDLLYNNINKESFMISYLLSLRRFLNN